MEIFQEEAQIPHIKQQQALKLYLQTEVVFMVSLTSSKGICNLRLLSPKTLETTSCLPKAEVAWICQACLWAQVEQEVKGKWTTSHNLQTPIKLHSVGWRSGSITLQSMAWVIFCQMVQPECFSMIQLKSYWTLHQGTQLFTIMKERLSQQLRSKMWCKLIKLTITLKNFIRKLLWCSILGLI